jgi:hypothetical protein
MDPAFKRASWDRFIGQALRSRFIGGGDGFGNIFRIAHPLP